MKNFFLLLFLLLFGACSTNPESETPISVEEEVATPDEADAPESLLPEFKEYMIDNAGLFTKVQKDTLILVMQEHRKRTTNEFVLLTVTHYGNYTSIDQYVADLHKTWELGEEGADNGIVLVVNPKMGELRISTGEALEKTLNKAHCDRIINTIMFPYFQANKMYEGMRSGLIEMARVLEGAPAS